MKSLWNNFVVVLLILSLFVEIILSGRRNLRDSTELKEKHSRKKRYLVFTNGGTAKYVAGYLGPIDTPSYINCNAIRNFQYQYDLPPNITTVYSRVPARPQGRSFDGSPIYRPDSSRKIAYDVIEEVLNREGKDGHECILRAICEVAETPVNHNGLVGELIQLFFTPGEHEVINEDYRYARKAGLSHVDCEKLYPHCPMGHGILDSFSLVQEFGFGNLLKF